MVGALDDWIEVQPRECCRYIWIILALKLEFPYSDILRNDNLRKSDVLVLVWFLWQASIDLSKCWARRKLSAGLLGNEFQTYSGTSGRGRQGNIWNKGKFSCRSYVKRRVMHNLQLEGCWKNYSITYSMLLTLRAKPGGPGLPFHHSTQWCSTSYHQEAEKGVQDPIPRIVNMRQIRRMSASTPHSSCALLPAWSSLYACILSPSSLCASSIHVQQSHILS
jgi:hypothetical protein